MYEGIRGCDCHSMSRVPISFRRLARSFTSLHAGWALKLKQEVYSTLQENKSTIARDEHEFDIQIRPIPQNFSLSPFYFIMK